MLGWTATASDQLDLLAGLLDGSEVIEGLAIDTELRWRLLQRLAAMGPAGDEQIDAELARDHTNAGQRHAAACRASVPDAEHKAAAWQADRGQRCRDRGDRRDRLRLQPDGTGGPAGRLHGEIFLPAAGDLGTTRWAATGRAGKLLFPYSAASPELLERIDAFLATPDLDPALARVMIEGRDIIDKALRSRALPE